MLRGREDGGAGDSAARLSGPHFLQIGPPESTELYELVVNVQEAGKLYSMIPPSEIGSSITFQYSVMGSSFVTEDFNGIQDTLANSMTVVEVKSQAAFLASYFKGFPNLTFKFYCGERVLGSASMDLQELSKFSNKKPFVKKAKIFVKTLDGTDVAESESLRPYLQVEVSLLPKDVNLFKSDVKKMLDAPKPGAGDCPRMSQIQSTAQNSLETDSPRLQRRLVTHLEEWDLASGDHPVAHEEHFQPVSLVKLDDPFDHDSKIVGPIGRRDEPTLGKPQKPINRTDILPRQYIREAAQKTCEELEDWKEQQQEIFKYELKKKTEKHLKKLSDEWAKQKEELQTALKMKIDNCQNLYCRLEEAIGDLAARSERLALREDEVFRAKEELDRKYSAKFQELRKASQLHQYDMEQKVHAAQMDKLNLISQIEGKDREIVKLKATLNKQSSELSQEQVATLVADMRQLEANLHKAVQSKAFFKEQWAKVLREQNEAKEQEQNDLKRIMQTNKDELATVGLVRGITDEVEELRRDQADLLKLKEEIKHKVGPQTDSSGFDY